MALTPPLATTAPPPMRRPIIITAKRYLIIQYLKILEYINVSIFSNLIVVIIYRRENLNELYRKECSRYSERPLDIPKNFRIFIDGKKSRFYWTSSHKRYQQELEATNMQKIKIDNLSEKEKGYLTGLFIGDGYSNYNKKDRHYNVEFYLHSSKDLDIQQYLIILLKKARVYSSVFKDTRYSVNRIRVSSKNFFYFFEREWGLFKKKGISNKQWSLGVVSGFIDAEGYVGRGSISIAQKDKFTIFQIKKICENLRVCCTVKRKPNTPQGFIYRGAVSTRFKYLPHNSRKVGRIYGCFP